MSIGTNIKRFRKLRGLTQERLAEKANISRSYLADVERDRYNPSVDTLKAIAEALNVGVDDLLESSDEHDKGATLTKPIPESSDTKQKTTEIIHDYTEDKSNQPINVAYFGGAKVELTEEEAERLKETLEMFRLLKAKRMKESNSNIVRPEGPPKAGPKK